MGRLVLAGLLCAASMGVAAAGPTRKVQIETDPPGATVYINDTADGPACEPTPCTINAPIGTPTIIIRLDKFDPVIEAYEVGKGKKPLVAKWRLRGALGTFTFDTPKGASVFVDDEDRGKVPVKVEVAAEPHHIVVKQGGKTLFDDIVEVAVGDEVPIKPNPGGTRPVATDDGETGDDGDGEGDGAGSGSEDGDKGGGGGDAGGG
ncbi:MAG TPA: PEGA domain-containing protein, partial [Kofleriaceae bacterium]|nr:PEGA domain-containing protein [Kofleriaceae bacterium]